MAKYRKSKKSNKKEDEVLFDVMDASKKAEDYIEHEGRPYVIILGVIALIAIGFFAFKHLYQLPKEKEASAEIMQAQMKFEQDSFAAALTNPGAGNLGFLDIIDNYGATKTGNLANYYAGVSYLHLGKFEAAIEYLQDFKAKGEVLPIMKNGMIGDAYSELEDFDKAKSFYGKAVAAGDNDFVTPYYLKKLGMLEERQGNAQAALKHYEKIQTQYPQSASGHTIEKYVDRAKMGL